MTETEARNILIEGAERVLAMIPRTEETAKDVAEVEEAIKTVHSSIDVLDRIAVLKSEYQTLQRDYEALRLVHEEAVEQLEAARAKSDPPRNDKERA